jgi:hypothetical protein
MKNAIRVPFKSLALSHRRRPPKLRLRRSEPRACTRLTTHRGLSRAGVLVWRIIAHGTTPGHPHGILIFWPKWERMAHWLWPTIEIPHAPYGLLQIRLKVYKGGPLRCPDGFLLHRRAVIAELHCDNPRLLRMVTSQDLSPYAACREDLHSLAAWVRSDPSAAGFEAIYGNTMLRSAAERLGFTTRSAATGVRRCFDRFFMIGLLLLYTNLGMSRLTHGATVTAYPSRVIMSRSRLLSLYGDRDGHLLESDSGS